MNKITPKTFNGLVIMLFAMAVSVVSLPVSAQDVSTSVLADNSAAVSATDPAVEASQTEAQPASTDSVTPVADSTSVVETQPAEPVPASAEQAVPVDSTSTVQPQAVPVAAEPEPELVPMVVPSRVSGIVNGTSDGPLAGALVSVNGVGIPVITGADGDFTIDVPAGTSELKLDVNYMGKNQTFPVDMFAPSINIAYEQEAQVIETLVVTAMGIVREAGSLPYVVKEVGADDVTANKDANFLNSLSGKVAGVNINSSSSGVGGASNVTMRGKRSISQSSNALYVIDGVPMLTSPASGDTEFGSKGATDPMADINPEDIESISVLSGAAAAALYGSDAANGAILVTTKRGSTERLSVSVSSSTEIMTPFVLPKFQNRYGTGDTHVSGGSKSDSWGALMDKSVRPGYDPAKDYFQMGITATENVSLSVGTDRNQTYFSGGTLNSKGIVPNNIYNRYNFTFRNTTKFLNNKMTLDVNAGYILQEDRNVINQGTYSNPIVGAYLFPRGDNWEDVKMYERYDTNRGLSTAYWNAGNYDMTVQNPYWVNYRNTRENRKDRYILGAALSYDVLDWLNVSGRIRMDNSNNMYERKLYASTLNTLIGAETQNGAYEVNKSNERQIYGDAMININKEFGQGANIWSIQANLGGSFSDMKYNDLSVNGPISDGSATFDPDGPGPMAAEKAQIANVFNVFNLSNSKTSRSQVGWREQVQSVFGSFVLGFRKTYFLTLTGRNDWPSALAGPRSEKSSFFYPSVGASVVLSNILPRNKNLSYLKLNVSWASVATAFERNLANPGYGWDKTMGMWSTTRTNFPFYALDPERTQSIEVGVMATFLRGFNLDFTYYYARTTGQTFTPTLSSSSGSSTIYIQAGDVLNTGIEFALGYGRTWKVGGRGVDFGWNTNFTFSTNKNKIITLADNAINPVTGEKFNINTLDMGGLGRAHFLLREGGSLGDLYSDSELERDANGDIRKDVNGNVVVRSISSLDDYVKLGSVFPKANMAWRHDFKIENFHFGFMISARIGGVVYSQTQAKLDYFGASEASAQARDIESRGGAAFIVNGIMPVDAYNWYKTIARGNPLPQYYTYSATNVRLQEASIGYTIPRKVLGNVCDITISVVGRNLWMIYNKAPFDPETTAGGSNFYQGVDNFMMPSLRNIGFNLRLNF